MPRLSIKSLMSVLPGEFSTAEAHHFLAEKYKSPQKALESWVKSGELIRLRRDLYAFSEGLNALAASGRIHGPSYVSFETALGFYGLIPERVETIMAVVEGRSKIQVTPIGRFEYFSQSRDLFSVGMTSIEIKGRRLLIASKEKALLDSIARRNLKTKELAANEIYEFVIGSLRVDEAELLRLSRPKMKSMASIYRNLAPQKLVAALEERKG